MLYKHYSNILFNFQEHPFERKYFSGCFHNTLSIFFSNTMKWLSLTIKKYIRLLIKKIARKYKKNYNKMKLKLKLKFVNKKLCLSTCYGFFTNYTSLLVKLYVNFTLVFLFFLLSSPNLFYLIYLYVGYVYFLLTFIFILFSHGFLPST